MKIMEINELLKELKDAKSLIAKYEEKERLHLISQIKKFGNKYSDEELKDKDIDTLEIIVDACRKLSPIDDDYTVEPNTESAKTVKLIDFTKTFHDVNSEFLMGDY